jgi:hypothetical protein
MAAASSGCILFSWLWKKKKGEGMQSGVLFCAWEFYLLFKKMRAADPVNYLLLLILLITACGKAPEISGVDAQKWREDVHGCKGYREKVADRLISGRKMLIGCNEKEINELLGKPDSQEIQTRGQHYFIYEIRGGSTCRDTAKVSHLRIRFDALNRVSELSIY